MSQKRMFVCTVPRKCSRDWSLHQASSGNTVWHRSQWEASTWRSPHTRSPRPSAKPHTYSNMHIYPSWSSAKQNTQFQKHLLPARSLQQWRAEDPEWQCTLGYEDHDPSEKVKTTQSHTPQTSPVCLPQRHSTNEEWVSSFTCINKYTDSNQCHIFKAIYGLFDTSVTWSNMG